MIKLNLSTTGWINNSIRVEMKNSYDSVFVSSKTPIKNRVDFDYELNPQSFNQYETQKELAQKLMMETECHHIEHLMEVITTMVLCWMMGYNRGRAEVTDYVMNSGDINGM